MKSLLMLFGYSEYQASCASLFLWSILILATIYVVSGRIFDRKERTRQMKRRRSVRNKSKRRVIGYERRGDGANLGGGRRDIC